MIGPRHPLGGAVLRWLVRNPGSTVEEIAAAVLPMPYELLVPPKMTPAERRELFGVKAQPALVDRHGRVRRPAIEAVSGKRDLHTQEARRRVTAVLSDLTRGGYVEARRPPSVAAWFVARMERHGITEALLGLVRWEMELSAATVTAWAAMVEAAMQSPGVWRPGATGAQQETYAALVELGVIEAPAQRWPTERAREWAALDAGTTIGPAAVSGRSRTARAVLG